MTNWTKLAELSTKLNTKTNTKSFLTVVPSVRPYISQKDAVYDYIVGHEFTIVDQSSPLNNCRITICDRHELKRNYGLTCLHIKFNSGMAPVEVKL